MKLNLAGNQIIDLLKSAEKTLMLLPSQVSTETVFAALALKDLIAVFGKKADVVCFGPLPKEAALEGSFEKVKNRLEPTDLVISFNWAQSMIEKVSYSVEGEKFNLIITPSGKRLDPTQVAYSYRGANYNLIVCLGITNILDLPTNLVDQNIFRSIPTVNIDNNFSNTNFGKVNVVDSDAESISGLVVEILKQANQSFPAEVAEKLLSGLRAATDNFGKVKNPATFEQAAYCTKMKSPEAVLTSSEENQNLSWPRPKELRSSKTS